MGIAEINPPCDYKIVKANSEQISEHRAACPSIHRVTLPLTSPSAYTLCSTVPEAYNGVAYSMNE